MKEINSVLKAILEKYSPKEDMKVIDLIVKKFLEKTRGKIKSMKIDADIFVGGSYAKNTMIKKGDYDIDIFLRFSKPFL